LIGCLLRSVAFGVKERERKEGHEAEAEGSGKWGRDASVKEERLVSIVCVDSFTGEQ
jgi:hypothetical protein